MSAPRSNAPVRNRAAEPAEDPTPALEILHPERTATIAGRAIVVREYGFVESMRLHHLIQPILADLRTAVESGGVPTLDTVLGVLAAHGDAIVTLLACAADVEPEWVAGLSAPDGEALLYLWWGANGPFWLGGVVNRIAAERIAARNAARQDGPTSTPPSSPTDTGTPQQ